MRATSALAFAGQALVVLGALGWLRPWTIALVVIAAGVWWWKGRGKVSVAVCLAGIPLALLALYPPIAFDETLYHLPFVRAAATSGAIRVLPDVRFGIFPQLHEMLCVPVYLALGDTATHFVAVLETLLLASLLARRANLLAAALFLGNPIVWQLGSVTHVDMALALFVTAGYVALDEHPTLAGFLLGTACSVKYLGWYFAAAAFVYLVCFGRERLRFLAALLLATLPTYGLLIALTGHPFHPFGRGWIEVTNVWRVLWDVTFARERLNHQPPYSPLFAVSMLVTFVAAFRDRRAAFIALVCLGYLGAFAFMPQDSRYLLPLLPLVSWGTGALACPLSRRAQTMLAAIAILPGLAYAGYRLVWQGVPHRQLYLEGHIAEYRALEHRGAGRIYVCGAEQLQYYGNGDMIGDVIGPYANAKIVGEARSSEELARNLQRLGVTWLLISNRVCPDAWQQLPRAPQFERVYADTGATLWRVASPTAAR